MLYRHSGKDCTKYHGEWNIEQKYQTSLITINAIIPYKHSNLIRTP